MKKKIFIFLLLATILFGCGRPDTPTPPTPVKITDLRVPGWEKYEGKNVTLEGIFVKDPLPMLVTKIDYILMDMPMPEDQYIVLSGDVADKIDPKEYGGARLKLTGKVISAEIIKQQPGRFGAVELTGYEVVIPPTQLIPYIPELVPLGRLVIRPLPNRYAVLFSGGFDAANNHTRYWNHLKFMYSTLVNKYGYSENSIYVLYADGSGRDTDIPVRSSATQANLQAVFDELREKSTSNDQIFVYITNHGEGFWKADPYKQYIYGGQRDANGDEPSTDLLSEATYNLDLNSDGDKQDQVAWDEAVTVWGTASIFDDTFSTMTADINYQTMIIVMVQCFSGGVIPEMAQAGDNRIVISSAGEYEPAWAMSGGSYSEFTYYFISALNEADPSGNAVNSDANGDGMVSMVEAFNYARSHDTQNETPWYEDNGDGVPHSGNMPAGGDGTLGSNTSLQ